MGEQELERKAAFAELLLHVARELGETLEPERVYERFRELLADVIGHNGVVCSSYDERDGLIRCEYAWVDGSRLDPSVLPPLLLNREGGGMQSRVIMTGEPLLFNDVAERVEEAGGTFYDVDRKGTVRRLPEAGPAGTRAAMMVPVKHEGSVIGVVQLMSDSGEYSTEQLEIVTGLVAQLAASVRNARLQEDRRRLEAAEAAARAVAAEREQAAHVLDTIGDGIVLVDAAGVIRLWNRAAERVTGLAAEGVQGRPAATVFGEWPQLAAQVPVAERGGGVGSVTLPVSVSGRDLWLSLTAVRNVDGVVYTFRDVTGERLLDEQKSDFLATISHELRTPMAAVYGASLTLLERELSDFERRQLLEMIAAQSARLGQITEEVLLTTQLDRGNMPLQREPVDVGELAESAVATMRQRLADPVLVEVEIAPGVGDAAGDRDRIQQVLVNLLDNATKYGRGSAVTVRVDGDARRGRVRVSVSDEGPGIEPADQARIFEKFYRADPHLTHAPGGTGLGLYISRELVQRMGGRLQVRSEPGAGATFVLDLPAAETSS